MLITEISIRRPVFAVMVMIGIMVVGAMAYLRLPVEEMPNVEFPLAVVDVIYPGASPQVVESEISRKVEEAINPIQGVKHISTTITEGLSLTVVEFVLGTNKDSAVQDVRDAMARIARSFPEDAEDPVVRSYDPTAQPIMAYGLRSNNLTIEQLSRMANQEIKRELESCYGVGRVNILGDLKRQINVFLSPEAMLRNGVGAEEVVQAIRIGNREVPVGLIENKYLSEQVRIKGKFKDPIGLNALVVANRNNIPIKLDRIAKVEDGTEDAKSKALLNNNPIVALEVVKIRGTNSIQIAKEVRATVANLNKNLPSGTELFELFNYTKQTEESLHELNQAMLLGIAITVLVVYLFLNSWRSTVITGLTLPVSLIGTYAVMSWAGFTINIMTLIGLSLAVGLVIDDAIVVRENIVRHLQMGKNHLQAALDGTKEVGLAVTASTLTIVAVFLPVAFMGGITGLFFREFGITVSAAVLISLFVSFTLDPMLSSIWRDPQGPRNRIGRAIEGFNRIFDEVSLKYRSAILATLSHPWRTTFATLIVFVLSCSLVPLIGVSFVPEEDKAKVLVTVKAPSNMNLDYTLEKAKQVIANIRSECPEMRFVYTRVGGGFRGDSNEARIYVSLTPRSERKRSQKQIIAELRRSLKNVAGVEIFVGAAVQGGSGGAPIDLSIKGNNTHHLKETALKLLEGIRQINGASDLKNSINDNRYNLNIELDRENSSDLGVNPADISTTLRDLLTGEVASRWSDERGEEYDVSVRLPKTKRNSEEVLRELYFTSQHLDETGRPEMVSLSQIAKLTFDLGPYALDRKDLSRQVYLTGNVEGRSTGEVLRDIKRLLSGLNIPEGVSVGFGGEAEDIDEAALYGGQAILLAIIFIYLIMASQFNSFIQPLAIMFTLPLALIGVFITLFITGDTINLMSLIGIITLMGLVTKNGILLVEFANTKRKEGLSIAEALAEAGQTRLRPIVMTSLATAMGILPLAIGLSAGSELRAPMARSIIGGTISSTVLTLFVIPLVYNIIETAWQNLRKWFKLT